MGGMSRIEKLVIEGHVLDERGTWIPLSEKVAREREFMLHLEKGEVLLDKQWVSIKEYRSASDFRRT